VSARPGRQRGQALIETAVTLPILIALFIGFLAAGVAAQAYVDLNTAVDLAAASDVTAPASLDANPPNPVGLQFARDTFNATIAHDTLLVPNGPITCPGNYQAGGQITCSASATLEFHRTAFAIAFPDIPISASATAVRSPYRSVGP
jgi:Flp pilus assembly protein TadG